MPDQDGMLAKVRALLAKAEAEGCTPPEAEALTAKAAELMARHGIDRARLAAAHPETDKPADRIVDIPNPWAQIHANLLAHLANAMRCRAILLNRKNGMSRVHLFGYESDLERADILYTSLLLQMASALMRAGAVGSRPPFLDGPRMRTWNRSFLLGYIYAVVKRVQEAETRAAATADAPGKTGPSTELVLADRSLVVQTAAEKVYPVTRQQRLTYSGRGYQDGHAAGQRANIGGTSGTGRALGTGK
jgi:hypothetical protein